MTIQTSRLKDKLTSHNFIALIMKTAEKLRLFKQDRNTFVDNTMLLENSFCLGFTVHQWVKSYLEERLTLSIF